MIECLRYRVDFKSVHLLSVNAPMILKVLDKDSENNTLEICTYVHIYVLGQDVL